MPKSNFCIVLPTLNEEKGIAQMIKEVRRYFNGEIIVADDGSVDSTLKHAKTQDVTILDRKNAAIQGLIASVIDSANLTKAKYVIVMDSDFQHPASEIPKIINKMKNNDLVICYRSSLTGLSFLRAIVSLLASGLAYARLGKKFQDPLSGYFCVKRGLLQKLATQTKEKRGFKVLFELLKNNPNCKIAYHEYDFALRKYGVSKLNLRQIGYFLKAIFS
ncbi:MAG: glycosyltransferase [archaeon]|jgi:dolichol-phosphate mannosyltransferase